MYLPQYDCAVFTPDGAGRAPALPPPPLLLQRALQFYLDNSPSHSLLLIRRAASNHKQSNYAAAAAPPPSISLCGVKPTSYSSLLRTDLSLSPPGLLLLSPHTLLTSTLHTYAMGKTFPLLLHHHHQHLYLTFTVSTNTSTLFYYLVAPTTLIAARVVTDPHSPSLLLPRASQETTVRHHFLHRTTLQSAYIFISRRRRISLSRTP
ncbi:uncharacterized protein K489DRAFT_374270 [Dissoconium aciculare CBS 342.82]|uniref:Uncharacterized protein n=1 Tax=Dissoconium aciculare CBS 342.82 TaxID=1314786 RepID=A0A6J3LRG1_9PEZI|nr:uncharacterized protein K489DRAFT_374270 [Dissoconium aciculare CBS 342.82]KAF1818426.1 hypothetical protein K489DRAFT_374270 [Dissoconium aciculare CBS 342.82]